MVFECSVALYATSPLAEKSACRVLQQVTAPMAAVTRRSDVSPSLGDSAQDDMAGEDDTTRSLCDAPGHLGSEVLGHRRFERDILGTVS
jgi:hypothetical protein